MVARGLWDEASELELAEQNARRVEEEVKKLEEMPAPDPSDIFDYTYGELPWNLREQREALMKEVGA